MKKLKFVPFILSLIITQFTFAQNQGQDKKDAIQEHVSTNGIDWAKDMTQKLDRICDLTPEQEKQILEVNLRYADKMEEAHNNSEMSEEAMKAHKDKLFEARLGEYNSILNKDQQSRLKDYRNELRDDNNGTGNNDKKEDIKEKAQENGYTKEEVKDKADDKRDDRKKEELKEKAQESGHTKEEVKDKVDQKQDETKKEEVKDKAKETGHSKEDVKEKADDKKDKKDKKDN